MVIYCLINKYIKIYNYFLKMSILNIKLLNNVIFLREGYKIFIKINYRVYDIQKLIGGKRGSFSFFYLEGNFLGQLRIRGLGKLGFGS